MKPSFELLTGRRSERWVTLEGTSVSVHRDVVRPLARLCKSAAEDGFVIKVASGYRTYQTQLSIWNEKVAGKRPILDARGSPLDPHKMTPSEIVFSILRWSAVPGASRHHWGTELDVFAENLLPPGYSLELTPSEGAPGGVLADFSRWLDDHLPREGFFRPYAQDKGGVSPEWWHLSYAPLSEIYYDAYTQELFEFAVTQSDMALQPIVLANLECIYNQYVRNITR